MCKQLLISCAVFRLAVAQQKEVNLHSSSEGGRVADPLSKFRSLLFAIHPSATISPVITDGLSSTRGVGHRSPSMGLVEDLDEGYEASPEAKWIRQRWIAAWEAEKVPLHQYPPGVGLKAEDIDMDLTPQDPKVLAKYWIDRWDREEKTGADYTVGRAKKWYESEEYEWNKPKLPPIHDPFKPRLKSPEQKEKDKKKIAARISPEEWYKLNPQPPADWYVFPPYRKSSFNINYNGPEGVGKAEAVPLPPPYYQTNPPASGPIPPTPKFPPGPAPKPVGWSLSLPPAPSPYASMPPERGTVNSPLNPIKPPGPPHPNYIPREKISAKELEARGLVPEVYAPGVYPQYLPEYEEQYKINDAAKAAKAAAAGKPAALQATVPAPVFAPPPAPAPAYSPPPAPEPTYTAPPPAPVPPPPAPPPPAPAPVYSAPPPAPPPPAVARETGVVKFYNAEKAFGFVAPASGGRDIVVQGADIVGGGGLGPGDTIEFATTEDADGRTKAVDVTKM